jgi:hypothetical protein
MGMMAAAGREGKGARRRCSCVSQGQAVLLVLLVLIGLVGIGKALECEFYNVTECGLDQKGPCEKSRRIIPCGAEGSSRTPGSGCFVVWRRSNESGEEVDSVHLKGCFLNNKQCEGQDSCVERTYGSRQNQSSAVYHCCCNKDFCNRDFKWDPTPTTTPRRKKAGTADNYCFPVL